MRDVQVRPDKSDHEITMKINQWAADTYPVTQKHLDAVRALENAAQERVDQLKGSTVSLSPDSSAGQTTPRS